MANTIQTQVIANGPRNLILKCYILGDGSGEETGTLLVDVSAYNCTSVSIRGVHSALSGFVADLVWDATTDVVALHLPDYEYNIDPDIRHFGGLPNNAGAGKTGDVLITTTGLGAGDDGSIILEMIKR